MVFLLACFSTDQEEYYKNKVLCWLLMLGWGLAMTLPDAWFREQGAPEWMAIVRVT